MLRFLSFFILIVAACFAARGAQSTLKPVPAVSVPVPTWNRDVAPIIFNNCASCHRPGEVAPFSLLSYADAKKRAKQIALVTESKLMPPWKADSHGELHDERRLTAKQIATLRHWAAFGAPEGNANEKPRAPKFPAGGWSLGKPDMVFSPQKTFAVAAGGPPVRLPPVPS